MILHAFLRLIDMQPAPIVPLFMDNIGNLYKQETNSDSTIKSFSLIQNVKDERIILHSVASKTEKLIGDAAIYAIEYKEKQVRFGNKNFISSAISDLEKAGIFYGSPFTLLEFAKFIESEPMINAALEQCRLSLEKISPHLFQKWLEGADLDENQKKAISNKNEPIIAYDIHLSFSSSFLALTNLTDYSRIYLHEYRKKTFSRAIKEINSGSISVADKDSFLLFASIFTEKLSKYIGPDGVETRFLYDLLTNESRGNIKITNIEYFHFIREISKSSTQFRIFLREETKENQRLILAFFLSNRSRQLILVMYIYYIKKFPSFKDFILSRSFLPSYEN